jgi:hypothetical protein
MTEDLRKAELVRNRLKELDELTGSYPEGHDMRVRLEELHIEWALEGVEEDIRKLMDAGQTLQLAWWPDSAVASIAPYDIGRCHRLVVFVLVRLRWFARIEPEEVVHGVLVLL